MENSNNVASLSKSKLGEVSAITMTTPNLQYSAAFYKHLSFLQVAANTFPFPWIQISDGTLLIMLRQGNEPFSSLTYYTRNLDVIVHELEKAGIVFIQRPSPTDMIRRFVFQSPDGFNISLVTFVEGFKQPVGPTALTLPPNDFFVPEKYPNPSCGVFGEYAHPVKDLDTSIAYWKKLGFNYREKYTAPYPWTIMSDGLAIIGLHQTDTFNYPVITYFAADQARKIENLKTNGLTAYTEKGNGSVTFFTPEQQYFNLFKIGL